MFNFNQPFIITYNLYSPLQHLVRKKTNVSNLLKYNHQRLK